jgi:Fur family ferric uptake transcriptional regulator
MDKKLQTVAEYLKTHDFKLTNQRLRIVETIFDTQEHFTADDLYDLLRSRGENVSKATVYRTLSLLCEGGIIESQDFGRGPLHYEAKLGARNHDHLICTTCGKVVEFRMPELDEIQEKVGKNRGFVIESRSFRLFGLCKACRDVARKGTARVASGNGG